MKWSEFSTARAACAYFFICPGLVYGLLTARLPALKTQTGADDAQIGLILLCLGVSGLAALCGTLPAGAARYEPRSRQVLSRELPGVAVVALGDLPRGRVRQPDPAVSAGAHQP